MMILFFLVVGFVAYELLKTNGGSIVKKSRNEDAIETLKKRFVNGEINQDEYDKMLNVIKNN